MYHRKKSLEELPQENTAVWLCTNEGCKGWMRDNFAFDDMPTCRICQSLMERSMKVLPLLENCNGDLKKIPKGIRI